jgi:hypothetical protein
MQFAFSVEFVSLAGWVCRLEFTNSGTTKGFRVQLGSINKNYLAFLICRLQLTTTVHRFTRKVRIARLRVIVLQKLRIPDLRKLFAMPDPAGVSSPGAHRVSVKRYELRAYPESCATQIHQRGQTKTLR